MAEIQKKIFSFNPQKGIFPFEEKVGETSKVIAYCDSEKMAEELISRISLLDSYQHFLESMSESKYSGDDMREAIKNRLKYPPDIEKRSKQ